ncbi:MAG: hypothetical protein NVS2B2_12210 [Ktedonobacteraceae bacterium]
MREMGIQTIFPGPHLSRRHLKERVYPYLLRGLSIDAPTMVWGIDITYIRLQHKGLRSLNFYPNDYDWNWHNFSPDGYGIDEQRQVIIYHRWGDAEDGRLERFIVVLNFSDMTHTWTFRSRQTASGLTF